MRESPTVKVLEEAVCIRGERRTTSPSGGGACPGPGEAGINKKTLARRLATKGRLAFAW